MLFRSVFVSQSRYSLDLYPDRDDGPDDHEPDHECESDFDLDTNIPIDLEPDIDHEPFAPDHDHNFDLNFDQNKYNVFTFPVMQIIYLDSFGILLVHKAASVIVSIFIMALSMYSTSLNSPFCNAT